MVKIWVIIYPSWRKLHLRSETLMKTKQHRNSVACCCTPLRWTEDIKSYKYLCYMCWWCCLQSNTWHLSSINTIASAELDQWRYSHGDQKWKCGEVGMMMVLCNVYLCKGVSFPDLQLNKESEQKFWIWIVTKWFNCLFVGPLFRLSRIHRLFYRVIIVSPLSPKAIL